MGGGREVSGKVMPDSCFIMLFSVVLKEVVAD